MRSVECPGLPASWLNGWLAAVGATVLDSRIRLGWTRGRSPVAVLAADDIDPVAALLTAWPDESELLDMPLAETWNGAGTVQRRVPIEEFRTRAKACRGHRYCWTLTSTLTDLHVDESGLVAHAPFDPAGPGPIKWLHHRLLKVNAKVDLSASLLEDSLAGRAARVEDNGLGFDVTRLGSLADSSTKWIDPIVETLAFFGLALLPVRGKGTEGRSNRFSQMQRGWRVTSSREGLRFNWPVWEQPLDRFGIDALLDAWRPDDEASWPSVGVHQGWGTLRFKPRGTSDKTRAFGARRL